jgi:hypothetical protein
VNRSLRFISFGERHAKCLIGKDRQECTHISLAKENSVSPGPPEEMEMAMMTRGLRTTALRKKTIERTQGYNGTSHLEKPPGAGATPLHMPR